MSQFYDLASLVVIPSGYKASTIYAQKPLTTDGQLSFSRASTATRVNASGLIEAVASNVPRLDYLGSSCPRLNLEPQRTNLATYSESFNNAAWQKIRSTITANAATAPDGTLSADTFTDTTFSSSNSTIDTPINATLSQAYTHSIFVKAGTAPFVYLGLYDNAPYFCTLNTLTGQIAFTSAGATSSVVSYGNGWYRISITITVAAVIIYPFFGVCQFFNTINYSGTGAYTAQFWGAQVEAGSYPTSYVKTEAAAVTRVADAASKTGISSLIGQTEGTLFVEIDFNGTGFGTENDFFIYVGNGSNTNSIYIDYYNDLFRFVVFTGGSLTAYFDTSTTNGTHKIALAYKSGSYAAYKNGVQIGVDAAVANPPTCSIFSLKGGASGFGSITNNTKQALLFKTRLTNAQLAELTTL